MGGRGAACERLLAPALTLLILSLPPFPFPSLAAAPAVQIAAKGPRSLHEFLALDITGMSHSMKKQYGPQVVAAIEQADAFLPGVVAGAQQADEFRLNTCQMLKVGGWMDALRRGFAFWWWAGAEARWAGAEARPAGEWGCGQGAAPLVAVQLWVLALPIPPIKHRPLDCLQEGDAAPAKRQRNDNWSSDDDWVEGERHDKGAAWPGTVCQVAKL